MSAPAGNIRLDTALMSIRDLTTCPVCNAGNCQQRYWLFDDRYGYPDMFVLMQCPSCAHQFLQHNLQQEEIGSLYSNYYPRKHIQPEHVKALPPAKNFTAWINGTHSRPCYRVPEKISLLDIGCGTGAALLYHRERGCEVVGTETDENIRPIAELYQLNVHFGPFQRDAFKTGCFDCITMEQVIEHLVDPLKLLADCRELLKPGGRIILSTPRPHGLGARMFGRRWVHWHVPYHLHFFSSKSMQLAAEKVGLVIEERHTVTPSDWLYYQLQHLNVYPEKGKASAFWIDSDEVTVRQKYLRKVINIMHSIKVIHLFTRLFDSLGLGDNQLFILRRKPTP
ncbi:MAG: class I SAM-dependent methyltransferase [Gammaproteobacteria bacterium]